MCVQCSTRPSPNGVLQVTYGEFVHACDALGISKLYPEGQIFDLAMAMDTDNSGWVLAAAAAAVAAVVLRSTLTPVWDLGTVICRWTIFTNRSRFLCLPRRLAWVRV